MSLTKASWKIMQSCCQPAILKISQTSECQITVNVEHYALCSPAYAKGMEYHRNLWHLELSNLSKNSIMFVV
jgi:hypothetical protein